MENDREQLIMQDAGMRLESMIRQESLDYLNDKIKHLQEEMEQDPKNKELEKELAATEKKRNKVKKKLESNLERINEFEQINNFSKEEIAKAKELAKEKFEALKSRHKEAKKEDKDAKKDIYDFYMEIRCARESLNKNYFRSVNARNDNEQVKHRYPILSKIPQKPY